MKRPYHYGSEFLRISHKMRLERDQVLKKLIMMSAGCILILAALYLSVFPNITVIGMIGIGVFSVMNIFFYQSFVKKFKNQVIRNILETLIPGSTYKKDQHIDSNLFNSSLLGPRDYTKLQGEDYVSGSMSGMKVEFSELRAIKIYKTQKKTQKKVVYNGLFFAFTLNESIHQNTLILNDVAENLMGKTIAQFVQKLKHYPGYELVRLESQDFENKFVVYSQDQVRARVLLNPLTMDNVTNFFKNFPYMTDISFQGDRLFISIKMKKNLFEPRLFGPVIAMSDIKEIEDIIKFTEDFHKNISIIKNAA